MREGVPRLTVGLPVYNGADYLSQSLEALLGQTFSDFELIVSSNASTDATDDIVHDYARLDDRIRLIRRPRNVGAAPNHNGLVPLARGEFFKWASADDLYARDLLQRCVQSLDEEPRAVLAHSWTAAIDSEAKVISALEYPLAMDNQRPSERLRSILLDFDDLPGAIRADDFYGVIRTDVLRRVRPHDSFYHADLTFVAELGLRGPFVQVPDWLYFRRHHAGRAQQANPSTRDWCANLDPRRRSGWNPDARLVAEFVWNQFDLPRRVPMPAGERLACYRHLAHWASKRCGAWLTRKSRAVAPFYPHPANISVESLVAGQAR